MNTKILLNGWVLGRVLRGWLLAAVCWMSMSAQALQDFGVPGYWLKDAKTGCAVFVSTDGSDEGPGEDESVEWDGACVDGMAQGVGTNVAVFGDGHSVYFGSLHQGRWHGFGRLNNFHQGQLISSYEGRFRDDAYHGLGRFLSWFDNEEDLAEFKGQHPDAVIHSLDAHVVEQVGVFVNDDLQVPCKNGLSACMAKATLDMLGQRDVALGVLPRSEVKSGWWKVKHVEKKQSPQGQAQSSREEAWCLGDSPEVPLTEPLGFRLLFPSLRHLKAHTQAGYQCTDRLIDQSPRQLQWMVDCVGPTDPTDKIDVEQTRQLSPTRLEVVTTEKRWDDLGRKAETRRTSTATWVGACPAGAVTQGTLPF